VVVPKRIWRTEAGLEGGSVAQRWKGGSFFSCITPWCVPSTSPAQRQIECPCTSKEGPPVAPLQGLSPQFHQGLGFRERPAGMDARKQGDKGDGWEWGPETGSPNHNGPER